MIGANICVWNDYGHIFVFPAETAADLEAIVGRIAASVDSWGIDEDVDDLKDLWKRFSNNPDRLRMFIRGWVGQHCRGHESFEQFEFNKIIGA